MVNRSVEADGRLLNPYSSPTEPRSDEEYAQWKHGYDSARVSNGITVDAKGRHWNPLTSVYDEQTTERRVGSSTTTRTEHPIVTERPIIATQSRPVTKDSKIYDPWKSASEPKSDEERESWKQHDIVKGVGWIEQTSVYDGPPKTHVNGRATLPITEQPVAKTPQGPVGR